MGMDVLVIVQTATLPVMKMAMLCTLGYMLSLKRFGAVLTPELGKGIGRLVFVVLLPVLVFIKLMQNITLEHLLEWWSVPLWSASASLLGLVFGLCMIPLLPKQDKKYSRLILCACLQGNTGNLPLVLVPVVCTFPHTPFYRDNCESIGMAYVMIGLWICTLFNWAVVYNILDPTFYIPGLPVDNDEEEDPQLQEVATGGVPAGTKSLLSATERADMLREETKEKGEEEMEEGVAIPHEGEVTENGNHSHHLSPTTLEVVTSSVGGETITPTATSTTTATATQKQSSLGLIMSKLAKQPPLWAIVLGMLCGAVPFLHDILQADNGFMKVVISTFEQVGGTFVPLVMMVLGSNLGRGPPKSTTDGKASAISKKSIFAIIGVRMVLLPVTFTILVYNIKDIHALIPTGDGLYALVILINATSPPAVNVSTICMLHGKWLMESGMIMFWAYMTYVPCMTAWMYWYTYFLGQFYDVHAPAALIAHHNATHTHTVSALSQAAAAWTFEL